MIANETFRVEHETAERISVLSRLSSRRGLLAIAADWAVIAGVFALAVGAEQVWAWVLAFVVIPTRQHALLIIMHDASHYRLLPGKSWNDRISNWLLAWPLLVSTEGYRQNHLAHHIHLNTERDPDWTRKNGKPEWEFPKRRRDLLALILRDMLGGGVLDQLRAIRDLAGRQSQQPSRPFARVERIAYYGILAAAVIAAGIWLPVLLLWFLPAFTVLPAILRIRSIAEHFGVESEHELNSSRNMHPAWWERLSLAPHNVGYHLDHHLYPAVPFYNLPRLHRVLSQQPDYFTRSHQSETLFGAARLSVLSEVSVVNSPAEKELLT